MPKLVYPIDCSGSPLDIAARALSVLRVQKYARRNGFAIEEDEQPRCRRLLLAIPLDELNATLDELSIEGLLHPTQEILGRPSAHTVLRERFSTLTWVDDPE